MKTSFSVSLSLCLSVSLSLSHTHTHTRTLTAVKIILQQPLIYPFVLTTTFGPQNYSASYIPIYNRLRERLPDKRKKAREMRLQDCFHAGVRFLGRMLRFPPTCTRNATDS